MVRLRFDEGIEQRAPGENPARQREAEPAEGPDPRAFRGREDAAVNATHDDDKEHQYRPHALERHEPLCPSRALAAGPRGRIGPYDPLHRKAQQECRQDAGQNAGCEQLADVGFGQHAVDHHDRRRRNENAEGTAAGDRASRQSIRIAELAHGGIGDLGHGGGGRDRRPADGAEAGAGTHRRHRKSAAQMADAGVRRAEQLLRHPGSRDQIAHEYEERHHRERIIASRLVDLGLHHREGRREVPVAQISDAEETDHAHSDGNRDAQQRKRHHQTEADQSFRHVVVGLLGSNWTPPRGGAGKITLVRCTMPVIATMTAMK